MIKYIAVFDFCDTIYNGQSLNDFINYYAKKKLLIKIYLKLLNFFNSHGILRPDINKALQLKVFRGLSKNSYENICKNFYNDIIKKNFNRQIVTKILEAKNDGFHVLILSGGLDDYIKYIKSDFLIDNIIANKMVFNNDICSGNIDSPECLGIGKLDRFNLEYSIDKHDYFDSLFYTDHFSDSVLFPIFKKNIIVTKENNIPIWAKSFDSISIS